ncbi:MAG TPA: lipopolysaccharide core heptose(I) kinase RfaP [Methylococcaceae bacterium]|nr:lipopolysaccharide core heptose(I) kinase RfaP [Methylococcaceae bacterium]
MRLELNPVLRDEGTTDVQAFERIMTLPGEVFRDVKGRTTLRFQAGGRAYFLKRHTGVGWREIFKNLFSLRAPVLGAGNEHAAIQRLGELGVATLREAGFGQRGWNPARQESFLITEELAGMVSLEDLCRDWRGRPPGAGFKRTLIAEVARIARVLHENGVNHRDFYICHFLFDPASSPRAPRLHLIDLHRAQLRRCTPERWVVKDLGALYFSAMDIGLTRRDLLRFLKIYRARPLRDILVREAGFWEKVTRRAQALYASYDPAAEAAFGASAPSSGR